ncbi:YgfZ/GcvT domain-containing protein [Legionella shakespearei]|uniref:Glycine cleavage T protein n=1 Tax=Legionella shakespearei DSM 23087 TaxID=1122169 RepID=A0A0W0Z1T3_9GAMM|nr:folate-binding protein YgfZ [Legionella shakespearei]KTD62771.1 glycine cleavage T protein [Legionella shakespearei DSM 23087]
MNNAISHLVNTRSLTVFDSTESVSELNKQKNYLFDLSFLTILDVVGDKANEFLQGQLTCDINSVSDIQMIQGAQCNLKGRILSLLDIINWNGFKLVLPKDISEVTLNSLSRTALLSRVSIKENSGLKVLGFYLQNDNDLIPESSYLPKDLYAQCHDTEYCYYHLGQGFYIFIIQADMEQKFCQPFIEQNQMAGSLIWHTLRLIHRQIDIYPESRGMFLPHRLGLQDTPYISFNKGCYKGQEIIARTHYRATLKHELRVYIISSGQKIYSGQKLFRPETDMEVGELVDYSILDEGCYVIAVSILKDAPSSVRLEGQSTLVELETPATYGK